MIVAGVMSGTSADGINVALVRISSGDGAPRGPERLVLLGHAEFPYPARIRQAVLQAMNAEQARVADLARLNFLLGEMYAEAVLAAQKKFRVQAELVGCHGQTLYHQGTPAVYLERKLAVTWQTGEGACIAARTGLPVVSDFRPADMAAGGKGAPLVPFLDYLLYRDDGAGRIVQNIGGIANLTAIPAAAEREQVFAFDTGPGNMVMDALMGRWFHRSFDRDGKVAGSGQALEKCLARLLRSRYFRQAPPKTAGREEFGREFVEYFVQLCGRARKPDLVATATALTARSIAEAIRRFVLPGGSYRELVVSGGGAKNPTLMRMLARELETLGLTLRDSAEFGIPAEAKEAVAFAVLAFESWHRRPSNMPSATRAKRPAVLGKISYV
jgi:anhydro-N-acetylmuramic acid kinase